MSEQPQPTVDFSQAIAGLGDIDLSTVRLERKGSCLFLMVGSKRLMTVPSGDIEAFAEAVRDSSKTNAEDLASKLNIAAIPFTLNLA